MSRPRDFRLNDGTVIDHLPVGTAARALELLGLPREGPITVGINVPSPSVGRKDIVRVEGLFLEKPELDRLALLGQQITVSIVRDGSVSDKTVLDVPERLMGILTCSNPTCITHTEEVDTVFFKQDGFPYRFKCAYCERVTSLDDVQE
ncbi:MAG: aspartate carbamoyltransferase regulatory subunit [Planctomycetota bacterium]|nr:aspartate carbamoyltransferase regulatory subunit [Planctomycetota bacterium]